MDCETAVVFLAAGKGSRLSCDVVPKSMVEVSGRPIIARGFASVLECGFTRSDVSVVVGYLKEPLVKYCGNNFLIAEQLTANGNAEALELGLSQHKSVRNLLVIQGDDCLTITAADLGGLLRKHEATGAKISALLTRDVEPATHKYRFVLKSNGVVVERRLITEKMPNSGCVTGVYCFDAGWLQSVLPSIKSENSERKLTKLIPLCLDGHSFEGLILEHGWIGVNTPQHLEKARQLCPN